MKEKESTIRIFSHWIALSQNTLGLNISTIRKEFSTYRLCLQVYIEKEEQETIVDIKLNDRTKLSCHFIEGEICDTSFLYPDRLTDSQIDEYICYLNHTYDYDFVRGGWILPNCYFSIKGLQNNYYFMFYKPIT